MFPSSRRGTHVGVGSTEMVLVVDMVGKEKGV